MWDARIYSSAALGLLYYFDNPESFGHPEQLNEADSAFSRAQFDFTMKKYIKGERIEWLYYEVPNIPRAQEYLFISGPVYPAVLMIILAVAPTGEFPAVRVINILIDILCLYLVIIIARRLFGEGAALIAGALYAVYLPFTLVTGMVSPEPPTIFMTLVTVYMILKFYEKPKSKYLYLAGVILALITLNRSTATLLFGAFMIGFLYDFRNEIRKAGVPVIKALIPFVLVLIPWLIITFNHYDTLTLRDPQYSEANFRSSSSIEFEGYDRDYVGSDFWTTPVTESIGEDIPGYLKLLLKKFVRLWSTAYNDYDQSFILNRTLADLLHLLIVLTAFFGVFIFLVKRERGYVYLFTIPVYYTLLHVVFHALPRYNLNAMPFMIMAAAGAGYEVYRVIAKNDMRRWLTAPAVLLIGAGLVIYFPESLAAAFMGPQAGTILIFFIKFLILAGMIGYLVYAMRLFSDINTTIKIAAVPVTIFVLLMLVLGRQPERWDEWKIRLDSSKAIAGNMIFIPRDLRLEPDDLVRISIDMTTNVGAVNPSVVYINGQPQAFHFNRPPLDYYYTQKMTYPVFDQLLGYGKERFRAWRRIPFTPEAFNGLADKFGIIDIGVRGGDSGNKAGSYIDVYGSYTTGEKDSLLMPGLAHSSIERFVEKGDPRIWRPYKISSDSAISYYIDNLEDGQVERDDLSGAAGRQYGRYRIFIEVKRQDNSRLYF
jgi:4-amino-4-deoxy-L-arabinose transferase-like glycosyltransferase